MITLRDLLPDQPLPAALQARSVPALRLDSRAVERGDLFLAVPGHQVDGRRFIDAAIRAGAAIVVEEGDTFAVHGQEPVARIVVPDLRRQVGDLAARFYGQPGRQLKVIGVTGTNGKTSITWFLRDALDALGYHCGLMGTLGLGLKGEEITTGHTTPDPITLQRGLRELCDAGADIVAMEVSSHALDQHRLGDTPVWAAVFSNLSRDHLDYHGDMDSYLLAKVALFTRPDLREAVINGDDPSAPVLLSRLNDGVRCIIFGAQAGATVRCVASQPHEAGVDLRLTVGGEAINVSVPLFGAFNRSNLMAVAGVLHGLGVEPERLITALNAITPVPGRMQPVREPGKPTVIVDYAHTPDGLEKALAAVREHFPGRLHCVVGCGGDRDTGKRPLMAAVAEAGADQVILTSDNPRGENPQAIVDAMLEGATNAAALIVELDRRTAVNQAVAAAGPGDVVLLAGKGHEDYQEIHGERLPLDDRLLAREALAAWTGQGGAA
ncbi:UDP-N-acetylmuramoyl-L-alanyl-D-glutamate--2,6-diaminopimelate ligase [Alloalcanivorax marinus]|uniref:UDP-N-acetylmuramoyl-L-alanyl-D-glutamate--2, 6-diaminopimelate ligase n=1 Tax=Alloalcanivorax marinus TaxID=1177169 RepID=UPI001933F162|nr:UDP-N-acetylmuramoyl-L-alanyl-D-glutamate--2,6-diaminopimelate ligase [Alloalcanivorax marinus]MBL7251786.1 UDP-N-acetylmuramoyl-L-alanyl-D-glutamate--2,6-diaminopimelate ligase [Alloalcanivorax marinus]